MDPITYAQACALSASRPLLRADVMRLYFAGASMMQVMAVIGAWQGVV